MKEQSDIANKLIMTTISVSNNIISTLSNHGGCFPDNLFQGVENNHEIAMEQRTDRLGDRYNDSDWDELDDIDYMLY